MYLNIAQIAISAILSGILYRSYLRKGSQNKEIKNFAIFFLIFTAYHIPLSVLKSTSDPILLAWFYNFAILLFFLMLIFAWKISLSLLSLSQKNIDVLLGILSVFGLLAIAVQIYDFRLPIVYSPYLLFWNANAFASWITRISGLLVGGTWVYVFSRKFLLHLNMAEKLKNSLLILMAAMFAISSLLYFTNNYRLTISAFVFKFMGFLSITAAVLISRLNNKKLWKEYA